MNQVTSPRVRVRHRRPPEKISHEVQVVPISVIQVGPRVRRLRGEVVEQLMESIGRNGLQTPVTLRPEPDGTSFRLVLGLHRLEAQKRLGCQEIKAFVTDADDADCEIMEIDENLVRADLTELEVAQHLARRKELYDAKGGTNCPTPGGTQKIGFARDTAASTGTTPRGINRSLRRAEQITKDVQDRIAGTPIEDSGVELDALAGTTPEQQREALDLVVSGAASSVREALSHDERDPDQRQFEKIQRLLKKASFPVQRKVYDWLGSQVEQGGAPRAKGTDLDDGDAATPRGGVQVQPPSDSPTAMPHGTPGQADDARVTEGPRAPGCRRRCRWPARRPE